MPRSSKAPASTITTDQMTTDESLQEVAKQVRITEKRKASAKESDSVDILIALCQENWEQARQSENQRAVVTNLIVIIAAATSGVLTQTGFEKHTLPLTILLIILGIYGALTSAKLYERHQFHIERARSLRHRLDLLYPEAEVEHIYETTRESHEAVYPKLSKLHLHVLWIVLNLLVALLGVTLTIIILILTK